MTIGSGARIYNMVGCQYNRHCSSPLSRSTKAIKIKAPVRPNPAGALCGYSLTVEAYSTVTDLARLRG